MEVTFYSAHMDTLKYLQEIAEKHNCYINFGFNCDSGTDIDRELLQEKGFNLEELSKLELTNQNYEMGKIWFELHERDTGNIGSLVYVESDTSFYFDKYDYTWDELSEDFQEFLEDEDEMDEGFIHKSSAETFIRGFGLGKTQKNGLVYRSGMALKYFADYVCDYLREERIVKTY